MTGPEQPEAVVTVRYIWSEMTLASRGLFCHSLTKMTLDDCRIFLQFRSEMTLNYC